MLKWHLIILLTVTEDLRFVAVWTTAAISRVLVSRVTGVKWASFSTKYSWMVYKFVRCHLILFPLSWRRFFFCKNLSTQVHQTKNSSRNFDSLFLNFFFIQQRDGLIYTHRIFNYIFVYPRRVLSISITCLHRLLIDSTSFYFYPISIYRSHFWSFSIVRYLSIALSLIFSILARSILPFQIRQS